MNNLLPNQRRQDASGSSGHNTCATNRDAGETRLRTVPQWRNREAISTRGLSEGLDFPELGPACFAPLCPERSAASPSNSRELSPKETQNNAKESNEERSTLVLARKNTCGEFQRTISHYYSQKIGGSNKASTALSGGFQFSICLGMELMYAHYWGAYGIPIYIPINDKLYFPINEMSLSYYNPYSLESGIESISLHHTYDIPRNSILQSFEVWENGVKQSDMNIEGLSALPNVTAIPTHALGNGERYCHFLTEVDDREVWQFEDHEKHVQYMKMAALKYPFKILPFYHLDARRFFSPCTSDKIEQYHDFYIQKNTRLDKVSAVNIYNGIKDRGIFQYKMDVSYLESELLHKGGLFWGIKMYMALGYPPYIVNQSLAHKAFPVLDASTYAAFSSFLASCATTDTPLTVHGSPQGMTIADPGVYLKEYLKQNPPSTGKSMRSNFPIDGKAFSNGLGLIDSFSSPYSWEKVLCDSRMSKLRICLAHFGGMGFMDGEFDPAVSPYVWNEQIARLIRKEKVDPIHSDAACCAEVYTDLSCYTLSGDFTIPSEIQVYWYNKLKQYSALTKLYEPVDTPEGTIYVKTNWELEAETVSDCKELLALKMRMIEEGICFDKGKINAVAESLKNLIGEHKKMRTRIMFGTDWPMTETSVKGVPRYNSAMFMMLALLTKKLGNKWDAWHQFTVINPLAFLGLIDENSDDTEETVFAIKMDKLTKMQANLKSFNGNKDITDTTVRDKTWALEPIVEHGKKIDDAYNKLDATYGPNGIKIPSSRAMKDEACGMFITLGNA